jgi:hypothetical protein
MVNIKSTSYKILQCLVPMELQYLENKDTISLFLCFKQRKKCTAAKTKD